MRGRNLIQHFLVLVTIIVPDAAYAELVVPRERVQSGVTIRDGQSSNSTCLGKLKPGQSLEWIKNSGKWRKVRISSMQTGYVSASYTYVIPDAPAPSDGPLSSRNLNELRIHYLPVGAGTCTVVECPGSDAPPMIIDCGSFGSRTRGPTDLDEHNAAMEVDAILSAHAAYPNVVISHGDNDHMNYLDSILDHVQAAHIWQGGKPGDYPRYIKELLDEQEENGAVLRQDLGIDFHNNQHEIGDELNCGMASVYILTVNSGSSKNGNSLVLSIDYNNFSAVFPGDAEARTENMAIENFSGAVRTTVLSGSHHGADTKGSNGSRKDVTPQTKSDWPDYALPEVIVYSHGRKFGHPRCTIVRNYHQSLAKVPNHPFHCGESNRDNTPAPRQSTFAEYSTEVSGKITITTDGFSPLSIHCGGLVGCATEIEF